MKDLLESIPSTNVKIIELYNKIDSNTLLLSPDFQRKLVWKKQHKYHFIETILKNYPFPEVYIASAEMDVNTIKSSEVVVDGQQRLSTIVDYIKSEGDFRGQNKIKSFGELTIDEKKLFLNYFVSVRDLKNIDPEIIKDIFMRINNTEYSLNAIEKTNAQYGDSEFLIFCKQLVDHEYNPTSDETDSIVDAKLRDKFLKFLSESEVFSDNDVKRMNDLQYVMTLAATLIESEYFTRNQKTSEYMEKYNASFDRQQAVESSLDAALNMFEALDFESDSYWHTKSNAFTLFVELSRCHPDDYDIPKLRELLDSMAANNRKYFAEIELDKIPEGEKKYFEFAKEAVNARGAREYRGSHISRLLESCKK